MNRSRCVRCCRFISREVEWTCSSCDRQLCFDCEMVYGDCGRCTPDALIDRLPPFVQLLESGIIHFPDGLLINGSLVGIVCRDRRERKKTLERIWGSSPRACKLSYGNPPVEIDGIGQVDIGIPLYGINLAPPWA